MQGFDIRLMDVDQPHLNSGIENIGRNMDRQIGRGMIRPEDKDAALRRIQTGTDFKQFADCDLVVEAATENEGVKREIFKKVCEGLPPNVLLATNLAILAAAPDDEWLEYSVSESPIRWIVTKERLSIGPDGRVGVPQGPGLGVTLDEDAIAPYRYL